MHSRFKESDRQKKKRSKTLKRIHRFVAQCRGAFAQGRIWERALALAMVTSVGRQTISGLICAKGHQHRDWTSDYRVFSQSKWSPESLFDVILKESLNGLTPSHPLVVAMDDTCIKKTGKKIPTTQYARDPLSPPFHVNFIRAQRFIQLSALIPHPSEGTARSVPIAFANIPPVMKPRYTATDQEIKAYHQRKRKENLSFHGVHQLKQIRNQLDSCDKSRPLIAVVDGSFCNSTVLKHLPPRTALIGRIRGDAKLHDIPDQTTQLGRKRRYGAAIIRPDGVRTDNTPWQRVSAFAAGKRHLFRIKSLSNLLWRPAGHETPLTLLVIAPLAYRRTSSGNTFYRQPAYLVCTDPTLSVQEILQYYVWRWDIEVNFRDEKQLMGVGKAQVRNLQSVSRAPAFSVCVYSLLILAGLRAFGHDHAEPVIPLPKWRNPEKIRRVSANQLRNTLRYDLWHHSLLIGPDHFSGFISKSNHHSKPKKFITAYDEGIFCVYN